MFSHRVPANLTANRLTQALAKRRAEGQPTIDLTESNPTRAGFDYPSDLLAPLASPQALSYAPEPFGLPEARSAVAAEYARRNLVVDADRIVLTASTSEAYGLLFKLLADPGDEVLVPRPSYPLFELLSTLDGVVARSYDLEYHGAWSIDMASIERVVTPRTRALLVVSPNNPTGSVVSRSELAQLEALCRSRDAALIVDEVFADYRLEGEAHEEPSGSVLAQHDVLAFSLGGLSKSVGLPQVKLGWMAAAGPEAVVGDALGRLELACDTYLSVSTPVQVAAPELLRRGAAVRAQIAARVAGNYRRLKQLAEGAPSCRVLAASAGWSAVIQVPTFRPEEELVLDLLTRDGVLVHPGYFFDFPRESFLIVSLLVTEVSFAEGIGRVFARACGTAAAGQAHD